MMNIMMKHPTCLGPRQPCSCGPCGEMISSSPIQIPTCTLPPINVKLPYQDQACENGSQQGGYQQGPVASYGNYGSPCVDDCYAHHKAKLEEKVKRCPEGNFVVKAESVKPEMVYKHNYAVFDGQTSYKTFFDPKIIDKAKPFNPKTHILKMEGAWDTESMYKKEYVPHPTIPYKRPDWAKAEEYHAPHGAMLDVASTTYNSAYTGAPGEPAKSTKFFVGFDPTRGSLDDRTTHKLDYVAYCNVERARGFGPNAEENLRLCHCYPFRGETTYQVDFTPKSGGTRKSFKRNNVPDRRQKVSEQTTYKVSYEPFYFKKCEPCVPHEAYDQMYPKHPCLCVNCCPPLDRYIGPPRIPVPPSPPCPRPCPPSDPCNPVVPCGLPYKLTIKNEKSMFDPTLITVEPNPNLTPCAQF